MNLNDLPDMSDALKKVQQFDEKKKLDAVGKEDGDVDNDGDKDSSDEYLMKRRKAISKAMKKEDVEQIDELSKKTLGSYVKKASKETRGNMMATQHGSGIPKKAKDIKLKQVSKRLKGMEKAGEKMAEETVEEGMATPESGTGKYYNEKKPTAMQLAKREKMKKVKALTDAGKHKEASALYKSEEVVNVLSPEELERVAQIAKEYDENLQKEGMKYGLTKGTGKPGGVMKDYLDAKAKKLEAEKKKQKSEYRNNPAFGDPSHHSNAKNK